MDITGVVSVLASVVVIVAAVSTLTEIFLRDGSGVFAFAWQRLRRLLKLLPARKTVWGTVYDSRSKRPIPYAKVQLLDAMKRVLETRIADANGRYGFLTTPASMIERDIHIQIQPSANGYEFPSRTAPSADMLIYSNLYFGGIIDVSEHSIVNFDIPMEPKSGPQTVAPEHTPTVAVRLSVAAMADMGFWLGIIIVPLNLYIAPGPFTLGVLFLFLGTASLRIWGLREPPFGTVHDSTNGRAMPFALMTLDDTAGRRVGFTVTDERGRYVLVVGKGTYTLTVFTPATIQPGRKLTKHITTSQGWITETLTL